MLAVCREPENIPPTPQATGLLRTHARAVADAGGLGNIEIRAMRDHGYSVDFSVGITGASTGATVTISTTGGVTSFMEMPNTNPPATSLEELERKYAIGAATSVANYSFFFGTTNTNLEAIKAIDPRKVTKPVAGHYAKAGVTPRRHLAELRTDDAAGYALGQEVGADVATVVSLGLEAYAGGYSSLESLP